MGTFLQLVEEPFREMILKFRVFLPNLMAMLTILVLGLAISWALKRLLVKLLELFHFDRVERPDGPHGAAAPGEPLAETLAGGGGDRLLARACCSSR